MIESFKHGDSCFVTLTYDDKHLPAGGSLSVSDYQKWLKKLRKAIAPLKLRYYLAGEYGDKTWRPHYHAIIFGLPSSSVNLVRSTWSKGHVVVGELNMQSAAYVAGYVTKKMTMKEDVRLNGKYPEFQRMSLRPGIGALAVGDVSKVLRSTYGQQYVKSMGDVPNALSQGVRALPLGRYLKSKIREELGLAKETPQIVQEAYKQEMRQLFKDNVKAPSYEKGILKILFKNFLLDKHKQERQNYLAKIKLYQGAKTI